MCMSREMWKMYVKNIEREKNSGKRLLETKPEFFYHTDYSCDFDGAIKKYHAKEELYPDEMCSIVLSYIFGKNNCQVDLGLAQKLIDEFYKKFMNQKPKNVKMCGNILMYANTWSLYYYSVFHFLYGLLFAYKNEYIKAVYHYMIGFKYSTIGAHLPQTMRDYIRFICKKLNNFDCEEYKITGAGSSQFYPAGMTNPEIENGREVDFFSNLIGLNGEVIAFHREDLSTYGTLKNEENYRLSKYTKYNQEVKLYSTHLIDSNYKLYKFSIYFIEYRFDAVSKNDRVIPDGFEIIKF